MSQREEMMSALEDAGALIASTWEWFHVGVLQGAALNRSGWTRSWFDQADVVTMRVAGGANGHLLGQLLKGSGYHDLKCVELLRKGARCRSLPCAD